MNRPAARERVIGLPRRRRRSPTHAAVPGGEKLSLRSLSSVRRRCRTLCDAADRPGRSRRAMHRPRSCRVAKTRSPTAADEPTTAGMHGEARRPRCSEFGCGFGAAFVCRQGGRRGRRSLYGCRGRAVKQAPAVVRFTASVRRRLPRSRRGRCRVGHDRRVRAAIAGRRRTASSRSHPPRAKRSSARPCRRVVRLRSAS